MAADEDKVKEHYRIIGGEGNKPKDYYISKEIALNINKKNYPQVNWEQFAKNPNDVDGEIWLAFRNKKVNMRLYLPPEIFTLNSIAVSFEDNKKEEELSLCDTEINNLQYNAALNQLRIKLGNKIIESESFLLAVKHNDNFLIVGMIAASVGHKFAVFNFIQPLSEEFIRGAMPFARPVKENPIVQGYPTIVRNLIDSSQYSRSLSPEEKAYAEDEILRLNSHRVSYFDTDEKILSIRSAVKENSARALVDALKRPRVGVFSRDASTKLPDSLTNMPQSLKGDFPEALILENRNSKGPGPR